MFDLDALASSAEALMVRFPPLPTRNRFAPIHLASAFSDSEVATLRSSVSTKTFQPGTLSRKEPDLRDSHVLWIKPDAEFRWLFSRCAESTRVANRHFEYKLGGIIDPLQLARYEKGQHFGWHTDLSDGYTSTRKLSFSLMLSRPEEFEGGLLEFCPHSLDTPLHKFGDLLVFPSFVAHRVTPVTRGCRMTLTWWVHGDAFR